MSKPCAFHDDMMCIKGHTELCSRKITFNKKMNDWGQQVNIIMFHSQWKMSVSVSGMSWILSFLTYFFKIIFLLKPNVKVACRTFATQIYNFFVWFVFEGCSKVAGRSWVSPLELCLIQRRWSLPLLQPHGPPESYTVFMMWEAASLFGHGFQGCRRQTQGLLWVNHTFLTSTRSWI